MTSCRAKRVISLGILEVLEQRRLLAAHIVGSATSYATIQAAVDAAAPLATITVDPGTYAETVTINKPLTLLGAQAGVDGRGVRGAESIILNTPTDFDIYANDVTIDGFTVQGYETNIGAGVGAGIIMEPSIHGTHIVNNIITQDITGIYLSNNSDTDAAVIQRNYFLNNYETGSEFPFGWNGSRDIYTDGGVSGGFLTNVLIDNNLFRKLGTTFTGEGQIALSAQGAGKQFNITISNNSFISEDYSSSKALIAYNVTNISFIGNTVTDQDDSSSGPVRFEGNANNVNIQYNSIFGNSGPGVAVDSAGTPGDSSGFVVNNNNLYNDRGIGLITVTDVYDGPVYALNDWWGDPSGPSGDGTGTGEAVWGNGVTGHYMVPVGSPGGDTRFTPWSTTPIDITQIPVPVSATALTATALSNTQIALAWTAPSSTALSQLVQRSSDGVNFTTIATLSPLVQVFTDSGLTAGSTFTYRILGSNTTGNSAPGNAVTATTPGGTHPPVAPSNLSLVSATSSTIALAWNLPSYTTGIASYIIYRNGVAVGTSTTTSFTDSNLSPSTSYAYTVATKDNTGAISTPSPALAASTLAQPPVAPAGLTLASATSSTLAITWSLPTYTTGIAGYTIYRNGTAVGTSSTTSFTDTGLASSTAYTYTVATRDTTGAISAPSGPLVASTLSGYRAPVAPTGLTAGSATTSALSITWSLPSYTTGIAGYVIYRNGTAVGLSTSLSFTDTGLTPATSYSYAVATKDNTGAISSPSSALVAKTLATVTAGQFLDPSFEFTRVNNYAFTPTTTNWKFSGKSGIEANGSSLGAASAPDGTQAAFIQGVSGSVGSFAQTLSTGIAGKYTISFSAARKAGATVQPIKILVDGVALASLTPPSNSYTTLTTASFTLAAGSHTFTFTGTATSGTATSFIDKVSLIPPAALTAPAAPTALSAAAVSASQINLKWTIAGSTQTSFSVVRSIDNVNFLTLATGLPATATTYADSNGLSANTTYYYRVIAVNSVGNSPASNTAVAATQSAAAPAAPSGLVATALSSASIQLTWAAGGTGISSYAVDRSSDGTTFTTVATAVSGTSTTWTDTSVLSANTTYYYRIRAVNTAGSSPNSNIASATTQQLATVTYVSDMTWTTATVGWGTIQKDKSIKGNPLKINGVTYAKGIGTHAASSISYALGGKYSSFLSAVGLDDEEIGVGVGSVDFQVLADGKVIFDSGVLKLGAATVNINVSVVGVQTLTLVANNGVAGNIDYDHADWGNARLLA